LSLVELDDFVFGGIFDQSTLFIGCWTYKFGPLIQDMVMDKKKKRQDIQERLKIQSQRKETKMQDSVKSVRFFKLMFQEIPVNTFKVE
jgi:hypothetical protein